MRKLALVVLTFLLAIMAKSAVAQDAEKIFRDTIAAVRTGPLRIFGEATRKKMRDPKESPRNALRAAGPVRSIEVLSKSVLPSGLVIEGETLHAKDTISWTVTYSTKDQLVEIVEFGRQRTMAEPAAPMKKKAKKAKKKKKKAKDGDGRFADFESKITPPIIVPTPSPIDPLPQQPFELPSQATCNAYPQLCVKEDMRTVEFLFATTRKQLAAQKVSFTGERQPGITFGAARVRIPVLHVPGEIKLPKKLTFWGYTLWEEKTDESKHFVIKSVVKLDEATWGDFIKQKKSNEALVFVHGFNNSFEDALYRHAQIIWDLQYTRGMSVLFSWASNAKVLDYEYDRNSALAARDRFVQMLRKLKTEYGIEKIHVLAHSMGNFVALESLAIEARTSDPMSVAEIIMAAPDVDRDHFWRSFHLCRRSPGV